MNRDWPILIVANRLTHTAFAVIVCCFTLATGTAFAQSGSSFQAGGDFAPAAALKSAVQKSVTQKGDALKNAALKTIAPSQNDSTFTPDPYYTPEVSLEAPPNAAQSSGSTWTPPGAPVVVQPKVAANPVKRQKTVRSLMESETWEPPHTPVTPGYDPSKLTHSPIPWLQQPGPPPRQQPAPSPGFSLTESARQQLPNQQPGNSIIRPNTISPIASGTNKMISNSFTGSGSKTDGNGLKPAPSQTLAPTLTIPRPAEKPVVADFKKPFKPKPTSKPESGSKSELAAKPSKSGSQSKTIAPYEGLPTKRKLVFDTVDPDAVKTKLVSSGSATKSPSSGSTTKPASSGSASKSPSSGSATKQASSGSTTKSKSTEGSSTRPPSGSTNFERTQLLALVGGEPIFVGDTLLEVNQLIEQHMGRAPESEKVKARRGLITQILPKLVNEKMLYVGALQDLPEEADIETIVKSAAKEFDEKALPDLLKKVKVDNAGDYDKLLRRMGSSLRQRRDTWARQQLTRFFVSEKLNLNREITHQQLLDEYRANVEEYKIAEKSKWEQIMVRFDRFSTRDEAYQEIVELGNRIVNGASLPAVAKKESHGFRASEGGQHDWTGRDALVLKEIDEAIFTLPIGKLSDVIETRDGLHIVRVIDRQEAGIKPFTEAQVAIKERLRGKMREEAFKKHIADLKERIPVEYFPFDSNDVASRPSGSSLK